jgi:thiol-disulfide isomerase/thioredoxin
MFGRSQTAPNFTVTDSKGTSHRLYQDYLDQGKTVVVELFFAACPPCNAIAPYIETLYQDWGAGQGDVQFIELSILATDTDAKVNAYLASHSTTCPAAGAQGGSVSATTPYTSGAFGFYSGTPTFIVIAPDKTLQWDVDGPNTQSTIDSLDAAILATGAEKLSSAIEEPSFKLPLSLNCNIVQDKLVIEYSGESTKLNTTLINMLGQIYTSLQFPIEKNNPVGINVSGLSDGLWALRVQDMKTNIVASYLFIKQ